MNKQQKNRPFQPDDYNETTEPLEASGFPVYAGAAYPAQQGFPAAETVPAAQPGVSLPPTEALPAYPYYQQPQAAYPVLPPSPLKKYRGHPPGGSPPVYDRQPARHRRRRSPLPGLVKLCFLLVQLTLLVRVLCLLFGVQNSALWFVLLSAAGDLFVQPILWLATNINLSVLAGTQLLVYLEFLVAILAYGLFSRLLALLLRALLN